MHLFFKYLSAQCSKLFVDFLSESTPQPSFKMSDSEYSTYERTPSPEPKKSTKNIKKRKSSSASRSEFETAYQRPRTPSPAQKKKSTSKVRASTSKNKNPGSSSSKKVAEADIFKIIRDEEKITDEQNLKTVKTTSSFTSRLSSGSTRRTAITDDFQKMGDTEDVHIPFSQYAQEFVLPEEFDDSDIYKKVKNSIQNPKVKKRTTKVNNKVIKRYIGHPPCFVINNEAGKGNKLVRIQIIDIRDGIPDTNEQDEKVLLSAQYVANDSYDEIIDCTEGARADIHTNPKS
ncbi:uncharacterized protein LOC133530081 [Cydia pomonella]|uniref:uncharacterized protein LOC133517537 n=1 Tax=Cydia pomonella TaxID=82600 RepID=UPI002ADDE22E|nr:uncharacterized protein LOC133517537 [Cydia pomonella]XP_061723899.1 uncharacterized protein LOC133530081 [Cydia pomonella]